MAEISPQWDAFANWLAMDELQRERLNLPKNQTEYAFANKISDRQLRRWKTDPLFVGLLAKKTAARGRVTVPVSPDSPDADVLDGEDGSDTLSSGEDEYQAIKAMLVKGAISGDPKYLDLYFKTYGKEFVAEEAAARSSDLAGLDMGSLILEAAVFLGVEVLAEYLTSVGWVVVAPGGSGVDG